MAKKVTIAANRDDDLKKYPGDANNAWREWIEFQGILDWAEECADAWALGYRFAKLKEPKPVDYDVPPPLPIKTNLRARRNLASIYLTDTSTDSVASVTLDTPPLAASTQLDSTLGCEEMSISDVVSSLETIPEASDQVDWHFKVKAHIECEAESEPKPYVSGKSRMGLRPRGGVQTPARYKYMN